MRYVTNFKEIKTFPMLHLRENGISRDSDDSIKINEDKYKNILVSGYFLLNCFMTETVII